MSRSICARRSKFLSTPSARRATYKRTELEPSMDISIHALREEGDTNGLVAFANGYIFLSTPSARRATIDRGAVIKYGVFLSTPSARRATPCSFSPGQSTGNFYPRPPRGGRQPPFLLGLLECLFLSTPSARRATRQLVDDMLLAVISIHALREEGDVQAGTVLGASGPISIHALREEGDRRVVPLFGLTLYFYPRPPRGGRPPSQDRRGTTQNFYPRPPRGGRHDSTASTSSSSQFLSTPSARRATTGVPSTM